MKTNFSKTLLLAAVAAGFISCSKSEPSAPAEVIPDIILDTDLGNSTDDVFALQALFSYQKMGRCDVLGVMQSRKVQKAKDLLDRFMHFYKADDIPIGLVEGEAQFFEIIPYYQLVDSLKADGNPLFEPTGIPLSSRLPAWKLYRKLLGEAADGSVTIVCVGMFTNLGLLLDSGADEYSPLSGKELVRQKVRNLDVMGGCFSPVLLRYQGNEVKFLETEYNIAGDIPMARKVIENWPGRINLYPLEEGTKFPSVHGDVLESYSWQPDNPLYQIYSRYDEWASGDVGQYLWDVVTTLHSILGEEMFQCTPQGYITIDDKGRTEFETDSDGNAHIISLNAYGVSNMWEVLNSLAAFHP